METISNQEKLSTNKIEELADIFAHAGGLFIKNAVKVVLLHGRPNRPLASHGDHLPTIIQSSEEPRMLCEETSDQITVRYVPDPNPNNEYYY